MSIKIQCPNPDCGKRYEVKDESLGRRAYCKKCGTMFTVEMRADETAHPKPRDSQDSLASLPISGDSKGSQDLPLAPPSPPADSRPTEFGRYSLVRRLGAGGMGEVWLAYDPDLQRQVAIKTLRPENALSTHHLDRFLREARLAAKLHHTNAVTIYQVGVEGQSAYIVMEYVEGESLDHAVAPGRPMEWREATRAVRDAAAGLAAAHKLGLIHRDIKPANLMRTTDGVTKVVDFGLARAQECQTQLTQQGSILGTPGYMAPEMWRHQDADARSDIYALACTYYCLVTGGPPFEADNFMALGYQHTHEPLPDPRQYAPGLPDAVCRILVKGASKEPAERYQSAAEMQAELDALLVAPPESFVFQSLMEKTQNSVGSKVQQSALEKSRLSPVVVAVADRWHTLGKWLKEALIVSSKAPQSALRKLRMLLVVATAVFSRVKATVENSLAWVRKQLHRYYRLLATLSGLAILLVMVLLFISYGFRNERQEGKEPIANAGSSSESTEEITASDRKAAAQEKAIIKMELGAAYCAKKNYRAAISFFTAVIKMPEATANQRVEALVNRGDAYGQNGDLEKAITDDTSVIDMPEAAANQRAKALVNRGGAYSRKGNSKKAITDYTNVVDMPEVSADQRAKALVNRGVTYGQKGDSEKAITDYTKVIKMSEVSTEQRTNALLNRGFAYGEKGGWEMAVADYTEVIDRVEVSADQRAKALMNRGVAYNQQGDWEKAIADLTKLIDMPEATVEQRADALVNRGFAYKRKDDWDKAIADDTKVIDMPEATAEQHIKALANRGTAYDRKGELDKAFADYTKVIDMPEATAEQRTDALVRRGDAYNRKGDWDKAIADDTKVINMSEATAEQRAEAFVNRGDAYGRKGNTETAIADYTKVIDMPEATAWQHAMALVNRGDAYGTKSDPEKAIADYTKVVEMPEAPIIRRAWALVNRGIEYGRKGDTEKEIADYTKVIDMPEAPAYQRADALLFRGMTYRDSDKAIADYTKVIEMPEAPVERRAMAFVERGVVYGKKDDHEKAIADLTAAIRLNPQSAKAYYKRGIAYAAKSEQAEKAAEKIGKALAYPTRIEFVQSPLSDVIEYLKDLHHIEIQLDIATLKDAGINKNTQVTFNIKGVSLRSGLQLMLKQFRLTYIIRNEVLLITTSKEANRDIADFTEAIRLNPQYAEAYFERGMAYAAMSQSEGVQTGRYIGKALASPTHIDFVRVPLSDGIEYLKDLHHIEIQFDVAALKVAGINENTQVTFKIKGVSLRSGLQLMLKQFGLTYTIQNEVLLITTPKEANREIADFTTVIDMPGATAYLRAEALSFRGMTYGQKGDLEKEIADYTTVIDLPGVTAYQRAGALVNRGITYGQDGDSEKEIADYTTVIDLPGAPAYLCAKALVNRGLTFREKGDLEKANADYTKVIDLPGAPANLTKKARELLDSPGKQ